ncbi:isoaspartyl peptidase/L-asparaginase family protein [Maricaulis maris]|uniref:isoaspartyl peptidase/L-asparaginase family protein n=1 Tax=Maricaulis maris TaxID=74318 RepID=UPI003A95A3BE
MLRFMITAVAAAGAMLATAGSQAQSEGRWALVIHGGAGVIERGAMTPEREAEYRDAMNTALVRGEAVLNSGGSALDAIEAVIHGMEDDPLFNAGRGAVFTAAGRNELDASIMDGASLEAGAVAGVTQVRHPISLARAVMDNSRHVMLQGEGAETFAREQELEIVPPAYFFTERRWAAMERSLGALGLPIPSRPDGAPAPTGVDHGELDRDAREHRFGTVGVVALDRAGNIAAGTSTGGTTAKRWGRVGDSPIIGAGTYANNASCGVSATGTGEYFIRLTVASRICVLVEFQGLDLQAASDQVIRDELTAMGGDGGIVALTPGGEIAWSFNTPGMYRARLSEGGEPVVAIYGDED